MKFFYIYIFCVWITENGFLPDNQVLIGSLTYLLWVINTVGASLTGRSSLKLTQKELEQFYFWDRDGRFLIELRFLEENSKYARAIVSVIVFCSSWSVVNIYFTQFGWITRPFRYSEKNSDLWWPIKKAPTEFNSYTFVLICALKIITFFPYFR